MYQKHKQYRCLPDVAVSQSKLQAKHIKKKTLANNFTLCQLLKANRYLKLHNTTRFRP